MSYCVTNDVITLFLYNACFYSFLCREIREFFMVFCSKIKRSSRPPLGYYTGDEGTGIFFILLFFLLVLTATKLKMSTHGKMGAFDPARESWTLYAERLEFYFTANGVTDDDTKKAIFVTVVGTQSYSLLRHLKLLL